MIPAILWTSISVLGLLVTARNLFLAYRDWHRITQMHTKKSLQIVAFTSVRSHALMIVNHVIFIAAGVSGIVSPAAQPYPRTIYGWAITLLALIIPIVLVTLSVTIHRDRLRATQFAYDND